MPVTPLKLDGMRMLPPPSLPVARVQRPAARAAAAPPLLPPGGVIGVPRVAAGFADEVLGGAGLAEFGRVGLAQDNRAGGLDTFDDDGVDLWDAVTVDGGAQGGGDAFGEFQVLDGDGDTMEGAEIVAAPDGFIRGAGIGEGLVGAEG